MSSGMGFFKPGRGVRKGKEMKRTGKLIRISPHVWIFPLEGLRDRPNLGYVLGEKTALAVDAGHSASHVEDFYRAIEEEGLPLPSLTVITHWHWDHTYGMHAVHGKTLARAETDAILKRIRETYEKDPGEAERFLSSDPSIRREYAGGLPLKVAAADETLSEERTLDLGGVSARLIPAAAPHTEDSLLILIPEDRVLFVGDAALGEFPSWRMDYAKMRAFRSKVSLLGADTVVEGHAEPCSTRDFLEGLW